MNKNFLKNLHKDFREDPYINNLFGSVDKDFFDLEQRVEMVGEEFFFDTMSPVGIAVMENELDYTTTGTIEGRRSQLEARWKTAGKCDLKLLQVIANSWRNGEITVLFTNAKLEIVFISLVGIPYDIENLKYAIETAKPAHIPISYTFKFRTFGMVKALGQTTQYWKDKGYTWKDMREMEGIS